MNRKLKKSIALLLSAGICASMMAVPASAANVKFTLNDNAKDAKDATLIKATYTENGILDKAEITPVEIDADADTYTVKDAEDGAKYFLWDMADGKMTPLAGVGVVVEEETTPPVESDKPTPTATADPTAEYTVKIGTVTGGDRDDVKIVKTAAAKPVVTQAPTPEPTPEATQGPSYTPSENIWKASEKGAQYDGVVDPEPFTIGALTVDFLYNEPADGNSKWKMSEDYLTGDGNPKSAGNGGISDSKAPAAGTVAKLTTEVAGVAAVEVVVNGGKEMVVYVFASDAASGGTKMISETPAEKITKQYLFNVEPGKDYYVYAGGSKIGFKSIDFNPASAAASINAISPLAVTPADDVEELVTELKVKAGETVTLKARSAGALEKLTLSTEPKASIAGPINKADGAEYYTFTMPTADTTVNAEYAEVTTPDLPEDQAWTAADSALDAIVLAADTDGKAFGPYNGLSGYGKWVKGGSKLTYTHTNGTSYSFDHGWQGGSGGDTKINFYFTPQQACIVTVLYTAQAGRPAYIAQGNLKNILASGEDGATDGHPAVITADIEDPSKGDVYVYGGSSNKQIYGIFADYYDPTVVVYRNVSGKINYTGSNDTANAKIVFTDTNDGTRYEVPFATEYSVDLRQNRTYDISVESDGKLSETLATTLDTNSVSVAKLDKTHDIDVVDIALTKVTGEVVVHEYTPNDGSKLDLSNVSLKFVAADDASYTYDVPAGSIVDNKYNVTMMPNHEYIVTAAGIDGYALSKLSGSYVMAAGDTAPFKNILITEELGEVAFTDKIEVGAGKTYTKISDAIAVVKAMKNRPAGEAGRVEIVIDPGVYTEQVIIDTAYVTLKAADENNKPEINWYYGIGYIYYSSDGGYYSEDSAVQKTVKSSVARWGCAVRIYAQYVLMENIKVIDTFNCKVVPEELADGVESAGPGVYGDVSGKPDRTVDGYDAMTQAATERAAAIAIDKDYFEAYKCEFVSSQDTFYTNTTGSYIKDCYIEGGTDYIYGGTQIVFDGCTLAWHGYSDSAKGGYITACSDNGRSFGYLFNNCTVTNSTYFPKNNFAAGGWGRNWGGANCHVVFDDITIADGVEAPTGWTKMGGELSESVIYVNNVHRADNTPIDDAKFNPNGTMEANGYKLNAMYDYFDGWTPPHYDGDAPEKTEYTTIWNFGRGNGAPDYAIEGSGSEPIEIEGISDNAEPQILTVDVRSGGKFNNTSRTDDLAQVNDGTKFIIPVVNGSVITFGAYNAAGTLTIDGQAFTGAQDYVYAGPAGTVEAVASGVGYMSYIRVVSPVNPTEATPVPRLTVTFDKGDTDAEGEAPAFEIVEQGKTVSIPVNRTLYKEGNTLTGWTDGSKTYAAGASFAPTESVTLTPVFTKNTLPYKGTVDFNTVKNSGAPSVVIGENKTGIYVVQDDNGNDLKMGIDTSNNGKFDNGNGNWVQINTNTTLTVPVYAGSEITVGKTFYGSETYTINGKDFTGGDVSNSITADAAGTAAIVVTNGGYFTNVTVTYPDGAVMPEEPTETPDPEEPSDEPVYDGGKYAIAEGEVITAGTVIDSVSGITMTFSAAGEKDFNAAKKNNTLSNYGFAALTEGNGDNGKVEGGTVTGTVYTFEPKTNGKIDAGIVLAANKGIYVTDGTTAIKGTLGDSEEQTLDNATVAEKLYGIVSFNVEAGKTYYVYCTGSKLGFYGFIFTPAK